MHAPELPIAHTSCACEQAGRERRTSGWAIASLKASTKKKRRRNSGQFFAVLPKIFSKPKMFCHYKSCRFLQMAKKRTAQVVHFLSLVATLRTYYRSSRIPFWSSTDRQ